METLKSLASNRGIWHSNSPSNKILLCWSQ